jgi:hypothetical protein
MGRGRKRNEEKTPVIHAENQPPLGKEALLRDLFVIHLRSQPPSRAKQEEGEAESKGQ